MFPPHPHRLLPVSCCTPWSCTWWAPSLVSQPASPPRHRTLPTCTGTSSLSLFGTPPLTCQSALSIVRTAHTHQARYWTQLGDRHGASCSSAVQQTVRAAHSLVFSILSGNQAEQSPTSTHGARSQLTHTRARACQGDSDEAMALLDATMEGCCSSDASLREFSARYNPAQPCFP